MRGVNAHGNQLTTRCAWYLILFMAHGTRLVRHEEKYGWESKPAGEKDLLMSLLFWSMNDSTVSVIRSSHSVPLFFWCSWSFGMCISEGKQLCMDSFCNLQYKRFETKHNPLPGISLVISVYVLYLYTHHSQHQHNNSNTHACGIYACMLLISSTDRMDFVIIRGKFCLLLLLLLLLAFGCVAESTFDEYERVRWRRKEKKSEREMEAKGKLNNEIT